MLRVPAKNSVKWIDLFGPPVPENEEQPITTRPDFEGVRLGVKHLGPKKVRPWRMLLLGIRQREAKRLAALRKDTTPDSAPEFWGDSAATAEGIDETQQAIDQIIGDAASGLEGVEGLAKDDAVGALDVLGYLDVDEQFRLMERVMEMQSLSKRQFFRPENTGDVAPE